MVSKIACTWNLNVSVAKDSNSGRSSKRSRKAWEPPKVKVLGEEDLDKYSIFDVIMPLPGKDVDYPGGPLGERYREFLRRDGLDPDNWVRKQKCVNLYVSTTLAMLMHLVIQRLYAGRVVPQDPPPSEGIVLDCHAVHRS